MWRDRLTVTGGEKEDGDPDESHNGEDIEGTRILPATEDGRGDKEAENGPNIHAGINKGERPGAKSRRDGCSNDGVHGRHGDALASTQQNADSEEEWEMRSDGRDERGANGPDEDAGGEDEATTMAVGKTAAQDCRGQVAEKENGLDQALGRVVPVEFAGHWDDGDGEIDAVHTADYEA